MVGGQGTFITNTGDGPTREDRDSVKPKRGDVNVSEDLLNRQTQDCGSVSPEWVKNVVWFFFKKYGSKKI